MANDPLPYAELLLFLAGTVLYGFLVRELLRRPDVVPGNWPLRALAASLLLWYAGTLLDSWLVFLVGPVVGASTPAVVLDVARGLGWLLAPPLLLHTLERLDAEARGPSRVARLWVLAGYLGLGLFVGPMLDVLESRSAYLVEATGRLYPLLVAHMALCLLPASWLASRLARGTGTGARPARLAGFLRALARLLPLLVGLVALGLVLDPWRLEPGLAAGLLRLLTLGALLLPGLLFAYHVQRYNLLRLSLSNRFLRLLGAVLLVVAVVILSGPALGVESDPESLAVHHRLVAWGLLLALAWSAFSRVVLDALVERSAALRVFLGRAATAPRLEGLVSRLRSLDGDEEALLAATAEALGGWLGSEACFLPRTAATEGLWRAALDAGLGDDRGGVDVAHRLRRLPAPLGRELDRHDLHAVFALRVGGELRGVLGLAASATGGAHGAAELEAVRLVLRQLEATLALRDSAARELEAERRAGERERLGMLGLVSASLAHEIKNPLSSMKVLAQALQEDLEHSDPDGEGARDLGVIVEQIDRLDRTAREILGFARPRAGERTDLRSLVSSAVYVLRAEARKRAVRLEAELGDTRLDVAGSAAAWQTVVFNLLKNAVEHTSAEGAVEVRLAGDSGNGPGDGRGGAVCLEVSNPGRLEPAIRDRLFEPFVTAGGDRPDEGSGLGLSLVARRAAEVGAELDADEQGGRVVLRVRVALVPEAPGVTEED